MKLSKCREWRDGSTVVAVTEKPTSVRPEIVGLVLGLAAALVGLPLISWGSYLTHSVGDGHTDFRTVYTAGYMLRTGEPLYDAHAQFEEQNRLVSQEQIFPNPFIHPAYEALLYVPLSLFSFVHAYWIWLVLNLLMLAAIYWNLRPELERLSPLAPWLPFAVIPAYLPFGVTLMQGQNSILFTLLFAIAFRLMRDERYGWAGTMLGAAAFRFQLLIPIAICFVFWRRWNVLIGMMSSTAIAALLSIRLGGFWPYVHLLMDFSKAGATGTTNHILSVMPNLRGLILSMGGGYVLLAFASIAVLCIAIFAGNGLCPRKQLGIAVTAAALVSFYGLFHDLSVLIIPCALLLASGPIEVALAAIGVVFLPPTLIAFAPYHTYVIALGTVSLLIFLVVWARSPSNRKQLLTSGGSLFPPPFEGQG